jgi:hypothetical protein
MNGTRPSILKPALIGGAIFGVLSSIPILNYLNCACCSLVIGSGFVAAYLQSSACGRGGFAFRAKEGAVVGVVAGLIHGVVATLGAAVTMLISGPMMEQVMEQMRNQPGMTPEGLQMIERFAQMGPGFLIAIFIPINLVLGALFGTLGGLIGGAAFKVEPPEPAPSYVPPVPPPPVG